MQAWKIISYKRYSILKRHYIGMKEISTVEKCSLAVFSGVAMSFSNPFDLVRFRMQATPELIRQAKISKPYNSIS